MQLVTILLLASTLLMVPMALATLQLPRALGLYQYEFI